MMMYSFMLLLLFCSGVICQNCVTEDFEHNLEKYSNNTGFCTNAPGPKWTIGQYSSVNLKSPNPGSSRFIALSPTSACMTSPIFTMTGGGIIEITGYVTKNAWGRLYVYVYRHNSTGSDEILGVWQVWNPKRDVGWQTYTVRIPGSDRFDGYVSFSGETYEIDPTSHALIDSFRFIGAPSDEATCVIYDDPNTISNFTSSTEPPVTKNKNTTEVITTTTSTSTETPTAITTITTEVTTTKTTTITETATTKTTVVPRKQKL